MKQKKHSNGEIIRILRQADGDGTVESICREHNISKATSSMASQIWRYGCSRCEKRKCGTEEDVGRIDAEKSGFGRGQRKKVVSPAQKKPAVAHVFGHGLCSERRACRYLGVPRSTFRYPVKLPLPHQAQLHQRIVALSRHYLRYG